MRHLILVIVLLSLFASPVYADSPFQNIESHCVQNEMEVHLSYTLLERLEHRVNVRKNGLLTDSFNYAEPGDYVIEIPVQYNQLIEFDILVNGVVDVISTAVCTRLQPLPTPTPVLELQTFLPQVYNKHCQDNLRYC